MAAQEGKLTAVIRFPGADYTQRAVLAAAQRVLPLDSTAFVTDVDDGEAAEKLCAERSKTRERMLFFSDYDLLPFEALLRHSDHFLSSSYIIRKALIRKHYLAHALHTYQLKHGESATQSKAVTPTTWHVEINFADELDELLMDDLYDLNDQLEANESREEDQQKWFILKPAMADRGNGIRLFASLDRLRDIFEEFEDSDSDEEEDDDEGAEDAEDASAKGGKDTAVMTSQLRHFVIQEYVSSPLLLQAPSPSQPPSPRKFHLRAYVLCVGALKVYLADEMLALFAPLPYVAPGTTAADDAANDFTSDDLRRHLTNTCLQAKDQPVGATKVSEENVFLFSELEGMQRSSSNSAGEGPQAPQHLTKADLSQIKQGVVDVLATTFTACATAGSIHWQMWPNAFEVFGIDLLVESTIPGVSTQTESDEASPPFRVWLLEINAQPDFAQTGSRLEPTIEHLFTRVFDLAVTPFFAGEQHAERPAPAVPGESVNGMTLCLDLELSKAWK
ncbi:putative tubulin--tyrosine ligase pby1 [Tilletia horrida]|nr:putative tubulin--tyrosine ligase pby1 [Tilletia horrida]